MADKNLAKNFHGEMAIVSEETHRLLKLKVGDRYIILDRTKWRSLPQWVDPIRGHSSR